ncbi:MAG TPA: type II secretion system protein [Patescibacteria group bacterium]|nr:type II secretion system protein [Patescibacteria group bacterium]
MKNSRGFSLIELAIVLMISGLLLSGFLAYYTVYLQQQKYDVTRARIKEIRTALTIYAANQHRLPCPEGAVLPKKSSKRPTSLKPLNEKAAEEAQEDVCRLDAPVPLGVQVFDADTQGSGEKEQVWIGIIPIRALRLNAEQAFDGWGNAFTFAVSRKLTLPDGMHDNPTPHGIISVVDEFGKSLLDKPNTGRWVVVSHGPSGSGAWTGSGGRRPCGEKSLDAENCNDDGLFVIAPLSRKAGAWFYDDLVIHDDLDAGGSILDRLIVCNGKRKFYAPGETGADDDGCFGPVNTWQGVCLQSEVTGENGEVQKKPASFALKPGSGAGADCGCDPGYTLTKAGVWDDGAVKLYVDGGSNVSFTDPAGNNIPVGNPLPGGALPLGQQPSPTPVKLYPQRTSLYTCVQ